jgi:hypothetical protein
MPKDPLTKSALLRATEATGPFPKVAAARQILMERAEEIIVAYMALASKASEAGKEDVAADILWKLIKHMPKQNGQTLIDPDAAKPKELDAASRGPQIQIGIALGGVTQPKQLAKAEIIDITPPKDLEVD